MAYRATVGLGLILATVAGCLYEYGRPARAPKTFSGVGWDSGLAYGDALSSAMAHRVERPGEPAHVSMNCLLYGLKPLVAIAAVLIASKVSKTPNVGLTVAAGFGVMFVVPNCFAKLTYDGMAAEADQVPLEPPRLRPRKAFPPQEPAGPPPVEDDENPPRGQLSK